jgi:NADH-quinone oxidoreductase subunit A
VPDYNLSYFYVFAFFLVGAGFVTVLLGVSRLVAPRKPSLEKSRTYESGEEPVGQAWGRYPSHFYIFALLFVVFDVEAVFIFPWATQLERYGAFGLSEMGIFVFVLLLGLIYAWKKGVLRWV